MEDRAHGRLFPDEEGAGKAAKAERSEGAKRPRVREVNRRQLLLRQVDVENLIGLEHEARAIWEFVGRLDLSGYYTDIRAYEGQAGSPAYDPRVLVSVWTYSYAKGISSAREIARLCTYDPAYQWLTGMEVINHHTLSDFRVKHQGALDELFVEILGVMSAEELVTLERVVHDGSKVRAYASGDTFRREGRIRAHLELAREHMAAMGDPEMAEEVGPRVAKARERGARERVERLEKSLEELEKVRALKKAAEEKAEARVSMTDPEARIMKHGGGGGYFPSYNMQISTDCAHGVIVGATATQAAVDYNELVAAEERIEAGMGRRPEQMVADGGFTSRANVMEMAERGVDCYGTLEDGEPQSAGQMKRRGVEDGFRPEQFYYDETSDRHLCPAGKTLVYESTEKRPGLMNYRYRATFSECQPCPFKEHCCPMASSKGRVVKRGVEDPRVVAFREKMESAAAKEVYKQRGPIAEFTNAWLKEKIGLRRFRVRGLLKASMEVLWACVAYNIQQWIRVRWRVRVAAGT